MDIRLDYSVAEGYKSETQIARVVTENWLGHNMFCPVCGRSMLTHERANKPVADFCCDDCKSIFELKSVRYRGSKQEIIADGAYKTMMDRIQSLDNPNLFIMTHKDQQVKDLLFIPKYFFVHSLIEPRKPLSPSARRAGWQGCNILYKDIPSSGKIHIVKDYQEIDKQIVLYNYSRTTALKTENLESRGWIMDVLSCVEKMQSDVFSLQQMYDFTNELQLKHPNNNFIQAKIRQQLQYLRDMGFIEFMARGQYKGMFYKLTH